MICFCCTKCGLGLAAPEKNEGRKGRCPVCNQRMTVPRSSVATTNSPIHPQPGVDVSLKGDSNSNSSLKTREWERQVPGWLNWVIHVMCFLLGVLLAYFIAPAISTFLAGLVLGVGSFLFAMFVGRSAYKYHLWQWWFQMSSVGLTLLTAIFPLLLWDKSTFWWSFSGLLAGYPLGWLAVRICERTEWARPLTSRQLMDQMMAYATKKVNDLNTNELLPSDLRIGATLAVTVAVAIKSCLIFFRF
jgi:hypothetical protein